MSEKQFVVLCQCGCGEPVTLSPCNRAGYRRLEPFRFVTRHSIRPTAEERFAQRVDKSGDCWLWTGPPNGTGYATLRVNGKAVLVHRFSYELHRGPIPDGLVIDHLCRTLLCVNPDHLEPVPQKVNVLRGESPMAKQARMTHCFRGHEFTPENTIREARKPNKRRCRTCVNAWRRERDARKRQEAAA